MLVPSSRPVFTQYYSHCSGHSSYLVPDDLHALRYFPQLLSTAKTMLNDVTIAANQSHRKETHQDTHRPCCLFTALLAIVSNLLEALTITRGNSVTES